MAAHPPFNLYNTLHGKLEPLEPAEPGYLRMYSCGPTVYSYAHIGNFRTFLTADLIVRTARAIGWDVLYASNVTDVGHLTEDDLADAAGEDKMAKALKSKEGEQFVNIWDLARYYTDALVDDWSALNLHEPDIRPRATEHITQQIEAIEKLIERGHAYETENAVYFDVGSSKEYGKLSGNKAADQLTSGTRTVVQDTNKRDPRDFALWKKDDKHLMQWYSPFGRGFPGWHIECSVMSMQYLGEHFDLHGGGEDLIFPHHECEIAQAEGLTGKPFADMWVHTRFLQVEGEKMSKSKNNFYTVRDLTKPESEGGKNIDPFAVRLALISGHYRKPFNFTFKNLGDCVRIVERFRAAAELVRMVSSTSSDTTQEHSTSEPARSASEPARSASEPARSASEPARSASEPARSASEPVEDGEDGEDHLVGRLAVIYERALHALLDDLNTPVAIAAALEGVKLIQGFEQLNNASAKSARDWLKKINSLLGLFDYDNGRVETKEEGPDPLAEKVETLLEARKAARKAKDFARADEIRDELDALGVEVMDTPEGPKWRKKTGL